MSKVYGFDKKDHNRVSDTVKRVESDWRYNQTGNRRFFGTQSGTVKSVTKKLAANNATAEEKTAADYVCDGVADDVQWNSIGNIKSEHVILEVYGTSFTIAADVLIENFSSFEIRPQSSTFNVTGAYDFKFSKINDLIINKALSTTTTFTSVDLVFQDCCIFADAITTDKKQTVTRCDGVIDTFVGSGSSNGGISITDSSISLVSCTYSNCTGDGLTASNSFVSCQFCTCSNNSTTGFDFGTSPSTLGILHNCIGNSNGVYGTRGAYLIYQGSYDLNSTADLFSCLGTIATTNYTTRTSSNLALAYWKSTSGTPIPYEFKDNGSYTIVDGTSIKQYQLNLGGTTLTLLGL